MRIILTSPLAALLHAVLVNMQCEQHVGVASLFLISIWPAGAACSDGRIQKEGSLLCSWGTEFTLILELSGRRRKQRTGLGQQRPQRFSKKGWIWKRIQGRRGTSLRGEPVNWTPACISCPLDWVSGAIKTAVMHTEGGRLGEVIVEQEAGAFSLLWCDDGNCGIQKESRRKTWALAKGLYKEGWRVASERKTKKKLHRAAQPLKLESIHISKNNIWQQHLWVTSNLQSTIPQ